MKFRLVSNFEPKGDQPRAIKKLVEKIKSGEKHQVLLGVTGSGKTYVISNIIEKTQLPALVISHNKTLAAQSYQE
ncbi:MAG: DEAD/DEAH box helicase family protein, partial [bacterium]|nr:DEAD/DEAH box helicase family protein [bacterium]